VRGVCREGTASAEERTARSVLICSRWRSLGESNNSSLRLHNNSDLMCNVHPGEAL